jgi:hypothetical protein
MTAPMRITKNPQEFELYRIVTDYEALQDGFADRIEDLNTTLTQVDEAGELTRGNMQRLLGSTDPDAWRPANKRKQSRQFGWATLAKALKGTGMALVLVVDDERFAPIKAELAQRAKPRKPAIARIARPAWLFKRKRAREMGKKRWVGVSDATKTRLAKRAARARWKKPKQPAICEAAAPAAQ